MSAALPPVDGVTVRWYGHASFLLLGSQRVAIDPFVLPDPPEPGIRFDYPAISPEEVDLLLVTHEHRDHNAVDVFRGDHQVIRSAAGTFESPIGPVVGIASEHDQVAGTSRGANVVYVFQLDGIRFCHLGDLGQSRLRPEQQAALGDVDVLFLPVGGRMVMDGPTAARVAHDLRPRMIVPMHYGTAAVNYLEPLDPFLEALSEAHVSRVGSNELVLDPSSIQRGAGPEIAVLSPPHRATAAAR